MALAALVGAAIGLSICAMASKGARKIRANIAESSVLTAIAMFETKTRSSMLIFSSLRKMRANEDKAFSILVASFSKLRIAHIALAKRLLPLPVKVSA